MHIRQEFKQTQCKKCAQLLQLLECFYCSNEHVVQSGDLGSIISQSPCEILLAINSVHAITAFREAGRGEHQEVNVCCSFPHILYIVLDTPEGMNPHSQHHTDKLHKHSNRRNTCTPVLVLVNSSCKRHIIYPQTIIIKQYQRKCPDIRITPGNHKSRKQSASFQ